MPGPAKKAVAKPEKLAEPTPEEKPENVALCEPEDIHEASVSNVDDEFAGDDVIVSEYGDVL